MTLLSCFVTSEVLVVLQRAQDARASRQLTCKRAVRALLNEYLNENESVDHLQAFMQASCRKCKDDREAANRILKSNHALGSVLPEAELKSLLIKGDGRKVRTLCRNFNTQRRILSMLDTFREKTVAATLKAPGVKLQDKPQSRTSRSAGGA